MSSAFFDRQNPLPLFLSLLFPTIFLPLLLPTSLLFLLLFFTLNCSASPATRANRTAVGNTAARMIHLGACQSETVRSAGTKHKCSSRAARSETGG
jgi:hypothetical protein